MQISNRQKKTIAQRLEKEKETIEKVTIPDEFWLRGMALEFLQFAESKPLSRIVLTEEQLQDASRLVREFQDRYCAKTGRILQSYSADEIYLIYREANCNYNAARSRLAASQLNIIDPNWMDTGPENLRLRFRHDPIGYFTYCMGMIFNPDAVSKPAAGYLPITGFLNSQKYDDYYQQLAENQTCNLPIEIRLANIQDKAKAYALLEQQIPETEFLEKLFHTNELLRRTFSLLNPFDLLKLQTFRNRCISQYAQSVESLELLCAQLRAVLAAKIGEITTKHKMKLRDDYVSHSEICEISNYLKGLSNFRMANPRSKDDLKNSRDYKAMLSLREFVVDEITKTRTRPPVPNAIVKPQQTQARRITASKFTGLKLGRKEK